MIVTIKGKFMDSGTVTSKKTGEVFPYVVVYNDKEVYQIFGVDGSKIEPFSDVSFEVSVGQNQYGLTLRIPKNK